MKAINLFLLGILLVLIWFCVFSLKINEEIERKTETAYSLGFEHGYAQYSEEQIKTDTVYVIDTINYIAMPTVYYGIIIHYTLTDSIIEIRSGYEVQP